jgi:hypothetical protein
MTSKDFSNWDASGTAVFLKDKLIITPGIENMKGIVYTTKSMPSSAIKGWEAHLDIDLGNDETKHMGSGGFALYYLRNVEKQASGLYGYTNKFDGMAIIISSFLKQRVTNEHGT